jgi:hypothetical protein
MSFIGRQDRMLLTGFAVALIVVFSRRIRWLLDLARVTMVEQSEVDTNSFVGRADGGLYRAKEQGRNCVCLSVEAAVA